MIRAFIDGVIAVLLAVVMGVLIALGLAELGLTDTPWLTLGPWLAGVGLLGAWQQEVSTQLAGGLEWSTTASGAPLLVTWVAALYIAMRAKRGTWLQGLPAAAGAAVGAALLVAASRTSSTVTNDAGSVTTSEGLTWLWSGDRPGTVIGAAALVAVVWLLRTAADRWWRSGRGVAWSLLLGLGIVLTAAVAGGLYYLTSSMAVGLAVPLLYPLAGTLALFGIAGAPVEVSLTRLTPEALSLMTWSESLVYGIGGTVAALLLAALVGLVMRIFKHRSTWLGAVTVSAALAAFLGWAMSTVIAVPASLGADTTVWVNPLFAAAVGAVLGLVTRFFAGRPKEDPKKPAPAQPTGDQDIEALLTEVGQPPA